LLLLFFFPEVHESWIEWGTIPNYQYLLASIKDSLIRKGKINYLSSSLSLSPSPSCETPTWPAWLRLSLVIYLSAADLIFPLPYIKEILSFLSTFKHASAYIINTAIREERNTEQTEQLATNFWKRLGF
jgi:hypothetical protein